MYSVGLNAHTQTHIDIEEIDRQTFFKSHQENFRTADMDFCTKVTHRVFTTKIKHNYLTIESIFILKSF